jgi:hypothetical protein
MTGIVCPLLPGRTVGCGLRYGPHSPLVPAAEPAAIVRQLSTASAAGQTGGPFVLAV